MSTEPPASKPPMSALPPTASRLHTYMVQQWRMRVGSPLTFSDGERIIAVLSSSPAPGIRTDVDVMILVELPGGEG